MKKFLIPVLAAAGLAAILLASCRHGQSLGPGNRAHDPLHAQERLRAHIEEMTVRLQATPAQRAAILSASGRVLPEMQAFLAGREEVGSAFLAAWQAGEPDVAHVGGLVDQRAEAARALGHELVAAAFEIRESLTPAQRAKVAEWIGKHYL